MTADSLSITVATDASAAELWSALTEGRSTWWPELVLDARVGSPVRETWTESGEEHSADGHVTEVTPPSRLAFVWQQQRWPTPLAVRVTITEDDGRRAVTLTEHGFAALPDGDALRTAHEEGWAFHLGNLLDVAAG